MRLSRLKYFSTLLVASAALLAGWWLWNSYMQSPWSRDGKVRAEVVSIAPQVAGQLTALPIRDNQFVHRGDLLFALDEVPYRIGLEDALAQQASARARRINAQHEATRRSSLRNTLSAEEIDVANQTLAEMVAAEHAAEAKVARARWELQQTRVLAPTDGWITNLRLRNGNFASQGEPLFALVDSHSFYVMGYFEETKLRHIRIGAPASIVLYGTGQRLQGHVDSIGRAIYDQSEAGDSGLLADIKPTVPWVRLAQRVPIRIRLDDLPRGVTLIAGTTCSITIAG
ncbi:HlyD family secretion protein [Pantoea sp. 1.19]|uniref:efflux RND transporter periplasmic adaptor subunit n=1 Tax=Pantoea sp. 1.19 TaxID=1925589 RepID=UPI000948B7A0|nr:HlyD family secretion protein [Pantoea sp. 1.19]